MEKFEFNQTYYFNVSIHQLKADEPLNFPLYAYMKVNANMVLCYSEKRTPTQRDLDRYKSKGLQHFACPVDFHSHWLAYLNRNNQAPQKPLTAEAVKAALREPIASQAAKKEEMVKIGHRMMNVMVNFANGKPEDKWLSFQECQVIADTIVEIGIQTHKMKTLYEDLLMFQQSKIDHTACVSTLTVVFGLIVGYTDEKVLAELAFSGLLHDVGHSLLPPAIVAKPISSLTPEEFKLYREHTIEGAQLLEEFGSELPALTREIVMKHHERFDGNGFPKSLRGFEIDELVQVALLADIVGDLIRGQLTGKELDPAEAFEQLDAEMKRKGQQYVNSHLFESIAQAVRKSKAQNQIAAKAVA